MKTYNFSQKNLNSIWVPLIVFIVFLMAIITWNLKKAAEVRQDIHDRWLRYGELCDNLEEAAGYLSEQARNYVITGNQDYLENYWEEVHTGKRREAAVRELKELGVSEKRIGLLESAKNYSDMLIYLETRAMRLAADASPPSGKELPSEVEEYILNIVEKSMNPEEKYVAAVELLFGGQYLSEKDVIGQYTRQFLRQEEGELEGELKRADKEFSGALTLQWVLEMAAVFLFLLMVLSYYYLVIRPVLYYHGCLMKENKEHLKPSGVQEINMLGKTINHALKAKDDFLADVSHEIRTPLNSVIGYETLLEQTELNPLQTEYVSCMKYASGHLLEMINHLLDYARLENTKQRLCCGEWSPESLLLYLENGFRHLAAKKKLELRLRIEESMPPILYGDEEKVRQIAANLVSNAVKFTKKGRVEVTLYWKNNSADTGRGILSLTVRDTGHGIKPEDIERIFEPFEQAGAAETGQYGGTGLGLPICQSLAKLMGGAIKVSSTGMGSIFTAELPQIQRDKKKEEQRHISHRAGGHVLLVEDNPVNQTMQSRLLAILGLSVEVASNGEDAIELFENGTFDLILMDLRMPVMNGYETAEKILLYEKSIFEKKTHESGRRVHTPMIALTADGDRRIWDKVQSAGMDGILVKPVDLETMKDVISRFVDLEIKTAEISKELEEDLLHIYCLEHGDDFRRLVRLSEEGKFKEMAELLHKLKGASGAAGMEDIRADCCSLEECLKNFRTLGITEIARSMEDKFAVWRNLDRRAEKDYEQNESEEAVAEQINAWRQVVARGEFTALSQWKKNRPAFSSFLGQKKTEALERALERYDYQRVMDLLNGE